MACGLQELLLLLLPLLLVDGTVKPAKPEAVLASQKEMRAASFLAVIVFPIMAVYCWD